MIKRTNNIYWEKEKINVLKKQYFAVISQMWSTYNILNLIRICKKPFFLVPILIKLTHDIFYYYLITIYLAEAFRDFSRFISHSTDDESSLEKLQNLFLIQYLYWPGCQWQLTKMHFFIYFFYKHRIVLE